MLRHIHNPNASPEGAQSCISLGYCASGWFQELVLLDKSPSGLGHGNHLLKYMLGVCITCINVCRWEYCQHKWKESFCRGLAALKFSPHHAKHLLKSRFVESCVWELFFFFHSLLTSKMVADAAVTCKFCSCTHHDAGWVFGVAHHHLNDKRKGLVRT